MAANYDLVTSQSSIQVLSPTVVQDVVVATIQTKPSRVIASLWIPEAEWGTGGAAGVLANFADNIEQVMASPEVVGATSGQALDASGLLQSEITFTVGYKPDGSPFPPATVDVTITADTLSDLGRQTGYDGVAAAMALIDAAYQNLVAVSSGQTGG